MSQNDNASFFKGAPVGSGSGSGDTGKEEEKVVLINANVSQADAEKSKLEILAKLSGRGIAENLKQTEINTKEKEFGIKDEQAAQRHSEQREESKEKKPEEKGVEQLQREDRLADKEAKEISDTLIESVVKGDMKEENKVTKEEILETGKSAEALQTEKKEKDSSPQSSPYPTLQTASSSSLRAEGGLSAVALAKEEAIQPKKESAQPKPDKKAEAAREKKEKEILPGRKKPSQIGGASFRGVKQLPPEIRKKIRELSRGKKIKKTIKKAAPTRQIEQKMVRKLEERGR